MRQPHVKAESPSQVTRPLSDETLASSRRLRELLGGCSEMHIWRLVNEEKYRALAFPKPFKINGRNYWRLGAVRRWLREREGRSPGEFDRASAPQLDDSQKQRGPSKGAGDVARKRHPRDHTYSGGRR
jgi:predicted DNA-binding transcriptional regulator AlpA